MDEHQYYEEQQNKIRDEITRIANMVADERDADVLLYNGEMLWDASRNRNLMDLAKSIDRRSNCLLILVTNGGDPDAAYRMAHCLQKKYDRYTVYISGYCRSAGTLIAVGAYEIIMDDHGQLGPLDVQINKPDELFESGSGLDMIQALDFLRSKTFRMFTDNMVDLKIGSNNQITFKSASDIAAALTSGLYNPIYQQFDPTKLGEISRAMTIAEVYGARLNEKFKNSKEGAIQKLVADYPSHSFVIHRDEARRLFNKVAAPTSAEEALIEALDAYVPGLTRFPNAHVDPANPETREPFVGFVSTPRSTEEPAVNYFEAGVEHGEHTQEHPEATQEHPEANGHDPGSPGSQVSPNNLEKQEDAATQ